MCFDLTQEAQQIFDRAREDRVDSEEEESEQAGHDHHHDRGRDRFLRVGQTTFAVSART
jgi:hypothetical protein